MWRKHVRRWLCGGNMCGGGYVEEVYAEEVVQKEHVWRQNCRILISLVSDSVRQGLCGLQYCTTFESLHCCAHTSSYLQIKIYIRQQNLVQYSNLLNKIFKEKMLHSPLFGLSLQIMFPPLLYQLLQIFAILFPQKSPLATIFASETCYKDKIAIMISIVLMYV